MDGELVRAGIKLDASYEVRHAATAANLVAAGLGISALPGILAADHPDVDLVALGDPAIARRIGVVRLGRRVMSRPAMDLLRHLRDARPLLPKNGAAPRAP
jgi:DNA-binding transcriptional LysR family regulator